MTNENPESEASKETSPSNFYDLTHVIPPHTIPEAAPIMGGRRTNNFPDCCAVGNNLAYVGSGTLIARTIVITAKHCGSISRVFLKGNDIENPKSGEMIRVVRQIDHPEPQADLKVLILEEKSTVTPRDIVTHSVARVKQALAVGFGTIDSKGVIGYGVKREVEVPIISLDCTNPRDTADYGCRSHFEMVAGHRGLNRDTCKGDSGGPLYISDNQGHYYLLGMTLRGMGTAICGDGGIYLRVDRFMDWIRAQSEIS